MQIKFNWKVLEKSSDTKWKYNTRIWSIVVSVDEWGEEKKIIDLPLKFLKWNQNLYKMCDKWDEVMVEANIESSKYNDSYYINIVPTSIVVTQPDMDCENDLPF